MFSSSPSFTQSPIQPKVIHTHSTQSSSSARLPRPKTVAAYTSTEFGRPPSAKAEMAASASSLYEVLGISASASFNDVKVAYRRLARVCHPDVVGVTHKETSANEFKKIHEAYSILSDPDKRANYDQGLFRRNRLYGSSLSSAAMAAAAASMSQFSGYTCKKWETDQCW
ncbi:hypothetical protein NL676_015414 [Syzygium grande]|nr:hypothetical protein NL676_015414 [Syzygium grande]